MNKLITLLFCLFLLNNSRAQVLLEKAKKQIQKETKKIVPAKENQLSNEEIIRGLKEALEIGSTNSVSLASKIDGFYKNPLIKIPFPPEAQKIEKKVRQIGMERQADDFIENLNRAAEEASKEAAPIFINAIKTMTLTDGMAILKGKENAATQYMKSKTSDELNKKFSPIVKKAIDKVAVTRYWNPLITAYNRVPGVEKKNPDLEKYVLEKTLDGLFLLMEKEEVKIRKDPGARVTDLLKKVFG